MNARCFCSSRCRGMTSGLRYSSPRRCRSATSPERLSYSTPNSDPIKAPISRVERGEAARTHATSFSCCASLRTQALPPASNRISALRPPSANAPCQRRIVSSSSKRTRATCSQLRPLSSNTSALARRANRCFTDPSRASAISAERSSPNKNPGRIIPSNESNSTRLARAFRLPNESGYRLISRRCGPGVKDTMGETRKLAAIMAIDVVGYSRLMGEDEAGTARAVREHREAARPIVASHGGRIVQIVGDGLLLEFPSVVGAVECAIAIQRLMVERNAETPEHRRIVYRIGVNLGDVLIEDDSILGDGVNIAARLEGICEPGGVLISAAAHDKVRGKIDQVFVDLGDKDL